MYKWNKYIVVENICSTLGAAVNDTADYTCVATNGLDQDEYTVDITVQGKNYCIHRKHPVDTLV